MTQYVVTVIQAIPGCSELFATLLRVTVDQPIKWVQEHADEIAGQYVADAAARLGAPVALWVAAA